MKTSLTYGETNNNNESFHITRGFIQVSKRNFTKAVKNLRGTSGTEQPTSGKSAVLVRLVISLD